MRGGPYSPTLTKVGRDQGKSEEELGVPGGRVNVIMAEEIALKPR